MNRLRGRDDAEQSAAVAQLQTRTALLPITHWLDRANDESDGRVPPHNHHRCPDCGTFCVCAEGEDGTSEDCRRECCGGTRDDD